MNIHDDLSLAEFFAPGVESADVPALFPLLRARDTLAAFITLFRGGDEEVLMRLLVLRELGARATAPRWSPQELAGHFAYLDSVKLETVLKRLRENGLLVYGEDGHYQLSPAGRNAMAAVGMLLQFSGEEDAELGYITAQVAGSQAVNKVSTEVLQHLLGRLTELHESFEQAIVSGSEIRIRTAKVKLDSVWKWIEKGTEIMRALTADADLDPATHRIAQAIGLAQSRMTRTDAAFQRTLNRLDRQRVHLGASGLSSSDIVIYLRSRSRAGLLTLIDNAMAPRPRTGLLSGANDLLDIAEYELLERERLKAQETALPEAAAAPEADTVEGEQLFALEHFLDRLGALPNATALADAVVGGDYPLAAYRLSLLALLNDPDSAELTGPVAELARLPLVLTISEHIAAVERDGVAELSEGMLTRNGQ